MELGTYSDLTSFIGEAFPYYRTWQSFTFLFWVGSLFIFYYFPDAYKDVTIVNTGNGETSFLTSENSF